MRRAKRQTFVRPSRQTPPERRVLLLDRIAAVCCRHDLLGPRMLNAGRCPCVLLLLAKGEAMLCPLIHQRMGLEEAA